MIEVLKQLDNGMQKRPYADHIYSWLIKADADETEEQILSFCQSNLRRAELSETDYLRARRSHELFVETMQRMSGGYYSLKKTDHRGEYIYTARFEYID